MHTSREIRAPHERKQGHERRFILSKDHGTSPNDCQRRVGGILQATAIGIGKDAREQASWREALGRDPSVISYVTAHFETARGPCW